MPTDRPEWPPQSPTPAHPPQDPKLELTGSRHFTAWLNQHKISLAFTTYQSGKLFLIGTQPNGRLSVFERTFNRCMGLWSDGQTLWMSSLYQLWRRVAGAKRSVPQLTSNALHPIPPQNKSTITH